MSLQVANARNEINFDRNWIERIILKLVDVFDIRIEWNSEAVLLTGVFAVAGGLVGGYTGGRMGAVLGAGVGGVTGLGVSTLVSLREIWQSVKEKLKELFFIVFNYLRRLDRTDYVRAFDILMACTASRRELAFTIIDFIADKLGRKVLSNISAGHVNGVLM